MSDAAEYSDDSDTQDAFVDTSEDSAEDPSDVKWAKSRAKKVLTELIVNGIVKKDMGAKEVQALRKVFSKWAPTKFSTNLKNLRDALARDYNRMLRDCLYYGNDSAALYELRKKFPFKKKQWHLSEAKPLLEAGVKEGKHE